MAATTTRWAWLRQPGFSIKNLAADLSAGITKSIDGVTGGMANAVLAGVNPVYGIYTVMIATPVGALFTSSVYMNIDSTGAIAATAGSMLLAFPSEQRPQALAVLTLLVGLCMLIAGILKLGTLTRFIPNAVMRGFITGIAINIILGQLSDFTGYDSTYANKVVQGLDTLVHFGQWNLPTVLVGSVTILLIVGLDRTRLTRISLLIALFAASALVPLLNLTSVPLVSSLGEIPSALPRPILPELSLVVGMVGPAIALTIIALAQSAGIGQAYANPDGTYPNASRDFAGQGAANVAGALFQALPAGGSLGGTAMMVKAGARSRWSNIVTGVMAAVIMLLFGSLVGRVALSALAALLIVVAAQTIKVDAIRKVWHTSATSRWLMLITLIATLIIPLQWAIFLGVALSIAVFTYRQSENATIVEVTSTENGLPLEQSAPLTLTSGRVVVLNLYGSLFFAGARNIEEDLPQPNDARHAVVILSLRGHNELGSTFIGVIERYAAALQAHDCTLILVSVTPNALDQLDDTDTLDGLGKENVFVVEQPGVAEEKAYARARALIAAGAEGPELAGL